MGDGWDGIPADVIVEILLRILLCPRGRLRLVCRHWRDVIDERAPEPWGRAKVLAFFGKRALAAAPAPLSSTSCREGRTAVAGSWI
ncbi:hypothetical protein BAE44_0008831 [Dichanthelium oligosanthes]|uniref:F-box domain-containing protein n=1 Tax=Dichanthelium oligosanthes TaxID=888268 RepID=A0A1E5VYI5_9POAL|nr:hypothetical protein BAE44_0008831 [Dichanthelium oligosanthes]